MRLNIGVQVKSGAKQEAIVCDIVEHQIKDKDVLVLAKAVLFGRLHHCSYTFCPDSASLVIVLDTEEVPA
jgi:hypothetical protein